MKPKAMYSALRRVPVIALTEELEAVAHAQHAGGAEAHGGEQHDALEERLPERRQVEDEEQVLDGAQHEGAEDRADRRAGAAIERSAADDDRGDRVQRVGAAGGRARLAGEGDEGQENAGDRGKKA